MANSFSGRTIAITGGCSGIGLATTQALLNAGATVYIADVLKAPQELEGKANVHVNKCDITSREACKTFIDSIPGNLDGLVNCAGICPVEGKMASDELFERIMSINVTGSWYMGTEAIQRMTQQKQHSSEGLLPGSERTIGAGVIVNIASGASLRGIAGLGAYCTSKHAVLGMTRSWAKEWPTLRVNAVAPGVTDTPLSRGATSSTGDPEDLKKLSSALSSRIPLGRMAYATDIADVILFALSDAASFMTGQVIPVNGGSD
ncbi:hypothetical protein PV10_01380 [Exophiala mesophila]|uniref:Uncharacterized protein n=1 Tax=Exophiala mesophila TaxID=212818 RepID=A0A0D2AFI9_EXOME|nr:uncharacterized protein PV10_01380 [Exophiala mesophila]KIV97663.1 hypothetical protein PV10_01380 [Exophiala mesophila]